MTRKKEIDVLNGIGIVFVVLGHYSTYMNYDSWGTWIYSWHMPLFFITGGYLFETKKQGYYEKGYKKYIKKQAKNTLIPYTVFFVISFCVMYLIMPMLKGNGISIDVTELVKLMKAFVLSGGYLETVNINNFPLWFFPLYFISKVVYYAISMVERKFGLGVFTVVMVCLSILTIPFQNLVTGRPAFHINVLPAAIAFMMIGHMFCVLQNKEMFKHEYSKLVKEIVAVLLIFAGILVSYKFPGNVAHIGSVMYIVGASMTVLGWYILACYNNGEILAFLGQYSFIILGLHGMVGGFFRNFIEERFLPNWDGPFMNFVLVDMQIFIMGIICWCWKKIKEFVLKEGLYVSKKAQRK
jgi:fucose 4-O-acetylase-like acetyltransferase